ncbi:MAG TPA: hypothetical protein VNT32_15060 [Thermoleophilaceae bacterium]|nr:hypothetical protein [Thermoleophilaceae bacterium]
MTKAKLILALALSALALAACGNDDDGDSAATSAPATTPAEAPAATTEAPQETEPAEDGKEGAELKAGDSQFGTILLDGEGQALYLFDKEKSDESECYDDCAVEWPPMLTEGEPIAGDGIDEAKLGTTERTDGTTQITYNGHPLYYYEHDAPGKILCHDVEGFGGLWLVVNPEGDAVS